MVIKLDSRTETLLHIRRVSELLTRAAKELLNRAMVHDDSKLKSPEVEYFDKYTAKLAGLTYGSPEYKSSLAKLMPALEHHYAHNPHHPEHEIASKEEWNTLQCCPGYSISNLGRVKSLKKTEESFLKCHVTPKGYQRLQLYISNKPRNCFVHTLVAKAFLGDPPDLSYQVNHKNGLKQDNRACNLEWMTSSENVQHAYDTGLIGDKAKYAVFCEELNLETLGFNKMETELKTLGYEKADAAGIWQAAVGEHSTHLGLTFTAIPLEKPVEYSGLDYMDLFDVVEMLVDWKAAGERQFDGDIIKSLEYNKNRYKMSDQLYSIMKNTVERYLRK